MVSPFCIIDEKINPINLIVCVLASHIKCENVLWYGHMHGNICDTPQVLDGDELDHWDQHLVKISHGLRQSVIDDAMDDWHTHLWAYDGI